MPRKPTSFRLSDQALDTLASVCDVLECGRTEALERALEYYSSVAVRDMIQEVMDAPEISDQHRKALQSVLRLV